MKKYILIMLSMTVLMFAGSNNSFAQWVSPGKLSKAHTKLEGIDNCLKCHTIVEGITDSACNACHEKLAERIKRNKGFHATVKGKCYECHRDHKGEDYDMIQLDREKFDHSLTGYVLKDKHKIACNKCHKKENTYLDLTPECINCHTDVHKKTVSEECLLCHNIKGWHEIEFDHDKNSEYKLTGKHLDVKCEPCHPGYSDEKTGNSEAVYHLFKFKPLKYEKCSDCHIETHKGGLKESSCESCHVTKGWEEENIFNHNDPLLSDYPLSGRHKEVSCELCHPKEKRTYRKDGKNVERLSIKLKPVQHASCRDCHYDVHKDQFKEQDCDTCHLLTHAWKDHIFNHDDEKYKGYKLEGMHKDVICKACHERNEIRYREFSKEKKAFTGRFKPVESERCNDCHYDVHKEQFKKQECADCHPLINRWKDHTFKHDSEKYRGYKLEGRHKEVVCKKCHEPGEIRYREFNKEKKTATGKFKPLNSNMCEDCHKHDHKEKYKELTKVKGMTCDNCHSVEKEWKDYIYEHKSDSKYHRYNPDGQVKESKCEECHVCDTKAFCLTCCFENIFRHY